MKPINSVLTIGAPLLLLAFGQPQVFAYVHPGAPLTVSDLQVLKANVDNNREPWKSGYTSLAGATPLTYTMQGPFAQVSRVGSYDQNLPAWRSDMVAVWNLSRMWYFTGDTAYAQKAHDILLAWANTQTEFSGNESMLDLGDYAYRFVNGADILRGTWPGWTAADTTAVKAYFANVLQPGANPWGESMYGAANKGALALVAQGLMAIFCDDTVTLDRVTYQARTLAHVGLRSSNDIGMVGDSLRDQGHPQVQIFSLTMLAEALWKQGIDIYPDYNNRLLAAGEYYARVNDLSVTTPFLPFGTTDQYYTADVTNRGFGAGNMTFNILQNAYVVRKGIPAPNMTRRLQEMPVGSDSFMFIKDGDLSTATPAAALAIPATTSITSGFSEVEIGGATPTGNSSYSGGTWTVQGGGSGMAGATNDSCHFTYKAVTGDCAIIAKVESVQNTHAGAKAGVMMRTSLSQGAPRAWMAVDTLIAFEQNIEGLAVYGGINYANKTYSIPSSSYWVKVERLGNIITGYVSPDGTNWAATDVGRLDNPPATWYVGLVVCSTANGTLNTSTFSNVQITGGNGGAPIVIPAAPAALLAASGENAVSLRWQPSFGATSYTINRATTSGGPYSTTVASGVTSSNYTDATVTNGTTYYYVVTAINSAGTSVNSPEDSATPFSPMVNLAFGGTASSSAIGAPSWEGPDQAFNRDSDSKWYNGNASNPGPTGWLRYDFGAGNTQTVKRYTVVSADVANRDPKTWTFQGSNDGSTWTTLDTQSNQAFVNRAHANTYNIANITAYRYYQINVTANNGGGSLAIAELGLWSDTGRTIADSTYRVLNKKSKKALDVYNNGTTDGTNVDQWTWNGGSNQKWTLTYLGNGQYQAMGVGSGKLLEVAGASTANGANIQIFTSNNNNCQKWTLTPVGNGNYKFLNVNSGKAVDVSGGSTADGANVIQWPYSGADNQLWQISIAP
ncbi:MAG: RICIN domain-containing protein [Verrucomicrobia bacterium]|nr:RICIN domain-containing protein [Verrucomicrobiota bacterium]